MIKRRAFAPLRLGIVGVGKIAHDQHVPALSASGDFTLVAAASRHALLEGYPGFASVEAMLADGPPVDAVSICTPPAGRDRIALAAITAGKHVMIEKPPGATVAEVHALARAADDAGVTLFASWHSREAAAVDIARTWLADRNARRGAITWQEDIRVWHPGQEWIMDAGGFGVFDPAINALSIATAILTQELVVDGGMLVVPCNRASPIAARVRLRLTNDAPVTLDLDFLQTGPQRWEIEIATDDGILQLTDGGRRVFINGAEQAISEDPGEYPRLYARFAEMIRSGRSEVDLRPLQLVADTWLVCDRETTASFHF